MFVDCVDSEVYLYFILSEEHQGGGHEEGEEHDDQGEGVGLGEVVSQSVSQLIQIFVNHLCRNLERSWVNNHHGPVQGYQ